MTSTKPKPTISAAAMNMLEQHILKPTAPAPNKEHDQLVWDECKRHIMLCINQNFQVTL